MTTSSVTAIENRGTESHPFGMVYLKGYGGSEERIGYVACPAHVHAFITNWGQPTGRGMKDAERELGEVFDKPVKWTPLRECKEKK